MKRFQRKIPGGWGSSSPVVQKWITSLKKVARTEPSEFVPPVRELMDMVASDPVLQSSTQVMFKEVLYFEDIDAIGLPAIQNWDDFLVVLNAIMKTPPQFLVEEGTTIAQPLAGLPITGVLNWTMATVAGYATYSNEKFNRYMKRVLQFWCIFLASSESRWVLAEGSTTGGVTSIPWLSDAAKQQMVDIAMQPIKEPPYTETFEEIFAVPDPTDPLYLGFPSYDAFFVREFSPGQRPVGDAPIVNACESAPLQYKTNVLQSASFHLKGQPYSLLDMLNNDTLATQFVGGTVYQAFLSALSYHRWHSPVDGMIEKAYVIDGTYYLENASEGFYYVPDRDPLAPMASQPFFTSAATRAVIFIKADDPAIGSVAVVPVGMTEVSSCEITVVEGQTVKKGDELGMFHFGGSTHCLVFQKGVELEFLVPVGTDPKLDEVNVAVKSNLARLKTV